MYMHTFLRDKGVCWVQRVNSVKLNNHINGRDMKPGIKGWIESAWFTLYIPALGHMRPIPPPQYGGRWVPFSMATKLHRLSLLSNRVVRGDVELGFLQNKQAGGVAFPHARSIRGDANVDTGVGLFNVLEREVSVFCYNGFILIKLIRRWYRCRSFRGPGGRERTILCGAY